MTTAHEYIARVLAMLPPAVPMRAQIATELRGHIDERVAQGHPVEDVLRQLGDPAALAESYLAAVPLEPAPHLARLAAKAIDALLVVVVTLPLGAFWWIVLPPETRPFAFAATLAAGAFGGVVYFVLAEYWFGRTLGKRVAGLHVMRESGAPIGLGQAVVRQIPIAFQFYWIDVLFALFTDRRQRAFELLSKTRVVRVGAGDAPATVTPGAEPFAPRG
jgi:uncharacterized RDD family membrane protein YckC